MTRLGRPDVELAVQMYVLYTFERALLLGCIYGQTTPVQFRVNFPLLQTQIYLYISLYFQTSEYTLLVLFSVGIRAYVGGGNIPCISE